MSNLLISTCSMNEKEFLMTSNPWIITDKVFVKNLYIKADISQWCRSYNILLSTEGNDHIMEYKTLARILDVIPDSLSWDGKFAMGVHLNVNWREDLRKFVDNKTGKVCFLNFQKHDLLKKETDVYLDSEKDKMYLLREILKDARVTLVQGEKEIVMFTCSEPTKDIIVGCPPLKCDILMTRSDFFDAIPLTCLKKYLKKNGCVIHFGRPSISHDLIAIDSMVLSGLKTHDNWLQCFVNYLTESNL